MMEPGSSLRTVGQGCQERESGYGTQIVEKVVLEHRWEMENADVPCGGARFVFDGLAIFNWPIQSVYLSHRPTNQQISVRICALQSVVGVSRRGHRTDHDTGMAVRGTRRDSFWTVLKRLITHQDKVLIGQKEESERHPIIGEWLIWGGYLETEEDVESGIKREIQVGRPLK